MNTATWLFTNHHFKLVHSVFFSGLGFSHTFLNSPLFATVTLPGERPSELAPPPANVRRRSNVAAKITVSVPVLLPQSLRAARCSPLAPSASSLLACYSTYRVGSDRTRQRDRVQHLSLATSRRKLRRHDWSRPGARVHRERPERRFWILDSRLFCSRRWFFFFCSGFALSVPLLRSWICGFRLLYMRIRRVLVPDLWT